jgi:hypothetical protein
MIEERIYLKDIQRKLMYLDHRSVRRWCHNNNVRVLSDTGSNRQFVLRNEFERATTKNYYKHPSVNNLSIDHSTQNHSGSTNKKREYCIKGENEKRLMSIFTNL